MNVLLVDDEPLARDVLAAYLGKLEGYDIVGQCANALQAFSALQNHKVDLMFLDINMPEITGMDFLKALKDPPHVIFTTAYAEFAVESYELHAVDYLLKPFSFERFMKALQKLPKQGVVSATQALPQAQDNSQLADKIMFVKSEGKLIKIDLGQLMYMEGVKDYVSLHSTTGRLLVHTTMKNLEEQLVRYSNFLRINKSYIINLNFVTEIWGNTVKLGTESIPIGNTYKDDVHSVFEKLKML